MTNDTTNSHGSEAQNENENETVEDRLLGAFDVATTGVRADALVIEANPDYNNRVGEVTIPTGGVLLLGNIDDGTTVDEALDLHDWQVGTAESTEDGTAVTVWEADTEEGR